jgi:hypothetical protein
LDDLVFEIAERLDELRCRETWWLRARRAELVREQRRLHVEELAVTRVLDERDALDDAVAGADGVSARTARETVETARALESLPRVAAAAYDGDLSGEQLERVVQLADESTDSEWAACAPHMDPAELARRARCLRKPTVAESQARRDARYLSMKWSPDHGMLHLRGALPDLEGALFEATIQQLTEQMRPAKGQPWELWQRRAADALLQLCPSPDANSDADRHQPRLATRPVLQIPVPLDGPATICGIPLPDARVEQLRANVTVEPLLVDVHGAVIAVGRRFSALSPKKARAIASRDGQCQCGRNCGIRHHLEIHHLVPHSWGGTDDSSNLVALYAGHHPDFIPHGPWALVGNPNIPGGLRRVLYTDLTPEEAKRHGLPPPPGPSG